MSYDMEITRSECITYPSWVRMGMLMGMAWVWIKMGGLDLLGKFLNLGKKFLILAIF